MQLHIMALHDNTVNGIHRTLTAVDDGLALSQSRLPASCRLPASVPRLAAADGSGRWLWLVSGAMMTHDVSSSSCSAHRVVSCRHSTTSQSAALSTGKKKSDISRVSTIQSVCGAYNVHESVHGGEVCGRDDGCNGRVCSYCCTQRENVYAENAKKEN